MPKWSNIFVAMLFLLFIGTTQAAQWMRYPSISPDGQLIAFSYQGDIWLVRTTGGKAWPLTTHEAYERSPVWSPDSSKVAFASDRHGQFDLFIVPITGGKAKRLTYHSAADSPTDFSKDGKRVLFSSRRLDAPQATLPGYILGELYSISIDGGQPQQELTTPAQLAQVSPDGKSIAYHDHKGYENAWRKHHTSAITRDVWVYDVKTKSHQKMTTWKGEDRNPVWSSDGRSVYYLSEQSGNFNVWQVDLNVTDSPKQLTRYKPHPVRFLSIANNGTLAYGYNGGLWICPKGQKPRKVNVQLATGDHVNSVKRVVMRDGATEFVVSPDEEEIAFVIRGEIFVASVDFGTTNRITNTPQQERSVAWAPDGRSLYFAAEINESWDIHQISLAHEEEKHFYNATAFNEEKLISDGDETFLPKPSPDGKQLAYLRNRNTLEVIDLANKKRRVVVPADKNYSYTDGDIQYNWSPDSQYLSFNYLGHLRWNDEIGIWDSRTGQIINISNSGYDEELPRWSSDGRALMFTTNRNGRRSHGGWGSEQDIHAFYLTQKDNDRARLSKEEYERLIDKEKPNKEEKDRDEEDEDEDRIDDDRQSKNALKKNKKPIQPIDIQFDEPERRIRRLTLHSAPIADYAIAPDGEAVVYLAKVENKWDIWLLKMRAKETRKLISLGDDKPGNLTLSDDGRKLFIRRGNGAIEKIELGSMLKSRRRPVDQSNRYGDRIKREPIKFAAEMTIDHDQERAYMFEHAWRQVQQKFYEPTLHGVDWLAMKKNYQPFLASINNNHDFAEMLSEMLGELNASHTGSGYRSKNKLADHTASLGLLYDVKYRGDGLRVAEVIKNGPANKAESRIKPGMIITHIAEKQLTEKINTYQLLNRRDGKPLRITVKDATGHSWDEVIKPIKFSDLRNLLYERWIVRCQKLTDKISGGKIGYVHVKSMNDSSFRRTFHDTLGRNADKQALVVDTRFNGGGWLHDDLIIFLSGQPYFDYVPRGKKLGQMGSAPRGRWYRPVIVVQNESNYSNGHMFPFAFKHFGLGKVVGTPIAGTGTAVWWETMIDPSIYFGIPQVGILSTDGRYLENQELKPDVLIYHDPNQASAGNDPQLVKAIQILHEEVTMKKKK